LFFFLNLAASASAASPKPAEAAQPKSAFVPPPASLATMARQSRKIVAQCPPARVAVLGPRGSGRSSLINLLCSATNTTPNDPRQSKEKQRALAASVRRRCRGQR
jgi:putative ribosome biogenesis GTPase RsgA